MNSIPSTPPKKRLLGALLAALPSVTVALCDDGAPLLPGDLSLFSGAKQVAAQLRQLARKNGAEVAVPQLLRKDLRHRNAPGLAAVAELLETGSCTADAPAGEVRLFAAPSREEEARAAAGAIRRLMRQGVRCGKIAVVCRDIAKYRAAVRYEFRMAEIPLYCDEPTTPEFSAPATAVRALLEIARGADLTENLTTLAKTGLCALSEEQVCALENYAYTWPLTAADWARDLHPQRGGVCRARHRAGRADACRRRGRPSVFDGARRCLCEKSRRCARRRADKAALPVLAVPRSRGCAKPSGRLAA